jgi:hypothetical protein
MTDSTLLSVREVLQLARMSCVNMEENTEGLDCALSLPSSELKQMLTVEDITFIHSLIPAYLRR